MEEVKLKSYENREGFIEIEYQLWESACWKPISEEEE